MSFSENYSITSQVVLQLLRVALVDGDAIRDVPDWASVYDSANRQGVLAIVFDGYVKLFDAGRQVPEMPASLKIKWIGAQYNYEMAARAQSQAASEMASVFAGSGIRTYVLKGQIFAECYPVPGHRRSSDMDCFLVSADGQGFDAWEKGNSLMEQAGFRVVRDYYKNSTFYLPQLMVENHRFLTPFRGNKRLTKCETLLQRLLREDAGADKVEGTELYRPPVMVSALFLIEHSYSHFLHEGLTLRHITDWMMFSKRHNEDIDWPWFEHYIDEFGFRKFYDAYAHLGEFISGGCDYNALTMPERRMMDSVWEGLDLHTDVRGVKGKMALVGNTVRSAWKYRFFTDLSMPHALWIQVKSYFFDKHPTLDGE